MTGSPSSEPTAVNEDTSSNGQGESSVPKETSPPTERIVILTFAGDTLDWRIDGGTPLELPVLLRRAAQQIETQLVLA